MLIEELVSFCNMKYIEFGDKCGCIECNHSSHKCSGSCYNCLYQIHFPDRFKDQIIKNKYDCLKMLYHYVCSYTHIYSSEIFYAFINHKDFLSNFNKYNIMSIGCGACPDLIALESFCQKYSIKVPIAYRGYDVNSLWSPIHSIIKKYCDENNIKRSFFEKDVISHFDKYYVTGTNIIIISYLISYFYNTNQIIQINKFFEEIAKNVVMRKDSNDKMLIIINDVNSYKRGRNHFINLKKILERYGFNVKSEFKFFDKDSMYPVQCVSSAYKNRNCLFPINKEIVERYNIHCSDCRSVQLILEVQ